MFPGVCRSRPQQNSEIVDSARDSTRQPAVVSLELNSTAVIRTEVVDVDYSRRRHRKPRNRSFSPLRHNTHADVGSSHSVSSCKSSLTDVTSPVTIVSCLARHSSRISPRFQPVVTRAAVPAPTTSKKIAATHLPPLLNADSECRVSEVTPRRKSEGAAKPLEVCALRLNPDARSKVFNQQQSTAISVNSKTAKSDSTTSSSSYRAASDVPPPLSLPLSDNEDEENNDYDDDDEEDQEMTEYRHSGSADKMSTDRSVGCGAPGITEASCPILSVRIEFGKKNNDAENATPPATRTCDSDCSSNGDGGGRRRTAGRTPYKTKNAKTAMSPSKAISVAGRGKVVVIDDGVYDQFARRQPPKYLSHRSLFEAMINKRAFTK